MTKGEMIQQLLPFTNDVEIVLRDGLNITHFDSMKYGQLDDYGTLFIDINQEKINSIED